VVAVCVMVNRNPKIVNSDMMKAPFYELGVFPASYYDPTQCELCRKHIPINTKIGHGKKYLDELKMWELLEQDKNHKPTYYENTFGITHDIASHIRDLLFSAIENDKSFGYLFYLLASEKNRTEIFYQNNPIDCIPDKKLIEEAIYNYQDDYPKKSLEEFLTYCDFNYSFYKKHKTDSHTNDYWFSIFYKSYSIFEDVRTLLFYPFSAFEFIKELDFDDENMKLYCINP